MISFPHFKWQAFQNVPSAAEAALVSSCCQFSLSTLEIYSEPHTTNYAAIEKEKTGVWRWAVVSDDSSVLGEGRAGSEAQARRAAEGFLHRATLCAPTA